MVECVRMDL